MDEGVAATGGGGWGHDGRRGTVEGTMLHGMRPGEAVATQGVAAAAQGDAELDTVREARLRHDNGVIATGGGGRGRWRPARGRQGHKAEMGGPVVREGLGGGGYPAAPEGTLPVAGSL
jgi:hypothetical protein